MDNRAARSSLYEEFRRATSFFLLPLALLVTVFFRTWLDCLVRVKHGLHRSAGWRDVLVVVVAQQGKGVAALVTRKA